MSFRTAAEYQWFQVVVVVGAVLAVVVVSWIAIGIRVDVTWCGLGSSDGTVDDVGKGNGKKAVVVVGNSLARTNNKISGA